MTSAGRGFATARASKMEEKFEVEDGGGITAVTDIGLWSEKKDAMWISVKDCQISRDVELM